MAAPKTKKSIAGIEAAIRDSGKGAAITMEEVAKHNKRDDSWIVINGVAYDITKFARLHPGGEEILRQWAGQDATEVFFDLHRLEVLNKHGPRLAVGPVTDKQTDQLYSTERSEPSDVPYSEAPAWRKGWESPFYTESHKTYRMELRSWLANNVHDEAVRLSQTDKAPPVALNRKVGLAGLYAARLGPGKHMAGRVIMGVKGEEFDRFHEQITHEEWARITGLPAIQDGLGSGLVIGLPPLLEFGSEELVRTIGKQCLDGDKRICLAISEPFAGSDVANIKATATKTADGKHYIVNGIKKWITGGNFSEYFVTAVRTGGPGIWGISLLLVERSEGLTTKMIKTSYGSSAGTAYVCMENVKVPVGNLLGQENGGFQCIMSNFNHERWFIVGLLAGACRGVIEECFKWCMQRKVFGKKLISQPVIRQKLARMVTLSESLQSWLDSITFQMVQMPTEQQFFKLGGPIALLKLYSTRVSYEISDNACQLFGGRSITKSGMGKYVEEFQRSVKYGAILGGSEEVMGDLGIRLAQRDFPAEARL